MLKDGFLRFCDNPEIACCKAEKELERLRNENAALRIQLAESQRREKAAVEVLNKIYERTRPGGKKGGYPYGSTTCIGADVYDIVVDWRGPQEAENGEDE